MTHHFYHKIHSFCVLLVAALLTASCTQEEELNAAVGYLHFPSFEVDMTVEDLVTTRAVTLPDVPADASQIVFVVKDKDGTEVYNKRGAWTTPLALPVGAYTIEATFGSNTFNKPYFQGTATGTITALGQEKPSLQMSLKNALVRVSVSAALAEHFTPGTTVTFTAGTTVIADYDTWCYVPAGGDVVVNLSGTNSVGTTTSLSYTLSSPAAGKAYNVVCDKDGSNWPTITLPEQQDGAWNTRLYITPATVNNMSAANQNKIVYELSESNTDWSNPVTAEHISGDYYVVKGLTNGSTYYLRARIGKITSVAKQFTVQQELSGTTINATHYNDGSGHLAGTNATVSLGLTGILKTLNDAGLLVFDGFSLSNGSTAVRSASAEGAVMSAADGWPYLPQGSVYVLTGNHKIKGESTAVSFTRSSLSVPAPTFTVSMGASYSSYDKYLASDITAANNCNAETIYGVSASWGISNDLLSNSNYTKSMKMYLGDTEKVSQTPTTNSYSLGNITGLTTWQAYTLKASVTFDGKTVEATKTHHITGLPYTTNRPATPQWTGTGNVDWGFEDGLKLYPNYGSASISLSFHVPGTINVSTTNAINKYDTFFTSLYYSVVVGNTTVVSRTDHKNGDHTFTNSSAALTTSDKSVTIMAEYSQLNTGAFYSIIKSFQLLYR